MPRGKPMCPGVDFWGQSFMTIQLYGKMPWAEPGDTPSDGTQLPGDGAFWCLSDFWIPIQLMGLLIVFPIG